MGAGQHFDLCVFFSLQRATSGQCCLARTSTMTSIASDTRQYSTTGTNFSLFQTCNCVTAALTCNQVNAQLRASGGASVCTTDEEEEDVFRPSSHPKRNQTEATSTIKTPHEGRMAAPQEQHLSCPPSIYHHCWSTCRYSRAQRHVQIVLT